MVSTKLHFKQINWVLYFPSTGNQGRSFPKYGVSYRDMHTGESQPGVRINLSNVLEIPAIHDHYPHQVAMFRESTGKGRSWRPAYITEKTIPDERALFEWLTELRV